ncbi:otolith matrix protein OMM-64-like isoform X2 [Ptychodera flava]|uniref:otolith matrix protein OMM-64-like isoform X2 n=1 Tax=Ptychodera flava TaxID=63121 RepID=UPI003969D066
MKCRKPVVAQKCQPMICMKQVVAQKCQTSDMQETSGSSEMPASDMQETSGSSEMPASDMQETSGSSEMPASDMQETSGSSEMPASDMKETSCSSEMPASDTQETPRTEKREMSGILTENDDVVMKTEGEDHHRGSSEVHDDVKSNSNDGKPENYSNTANEIIGDCVHGEQNEKEENTDSIGECVNTTAAIEKSECDEDKSSGMDDEKKTDVNRSEDNTATENRETESKDMGDDDGVDDEELNLIMNLDPSLLVTLDEAADDSGTEEATPDIDNGISSNQDDFKDTDLYDGENGDDCDQTLTEGYDGQQTGTQ